MQNNRKMLIDAAHPEETRVVLLSGSKIEEFNVEVLERRPLKGNIYLGQITRIEASLQAAFVEYGGNRHGFLPFNEIHPDYFRISEEEKYQILKQNNLSTRVVNKEKDDTSGGERENNNTTSSYNYNKLKIQDVLKRDQYVLIQVVKEERNNKGASLTTWISLTGRFCVLMPNTVEAGGVSRKIPSSSDRKRLKTILDTIGIPENMSVIVRTAGAGKSEIEVRRDMEYLINLWNYIRSEVFNSVAPALLYEEASLLKRAIRDIFSRDVEEVIIEGEEAYEDSITLLKLLMLEKPKNIKLYNDPYIPLFQRYNLETKMEDIQSDIVHLRSGAYLVIDPTEALVAIDVNSGRATKENNIEETATKTNLEAAEEIARQLKLRDLGGLIVIDFIDMEDNANKVKVEKRLREALREDKAKIQVGEITQFGLLEISRQRINPSVFETIFEKCACCKGRGIVRVPQSASVRIMRLLEEEVRKSKTGELHVKVSQETADWLLNQKKRRLADLEDMHNVLIYIFGTYDPIDYEFKWLSEDSEERFKEIGLIENDNDDKSSISRKLKAINTGKIYEKDLDISSDEKREERKSTQQVRKRNNHNNNNNGYRNNRRREISPSIIGKLKNFFFG